MTTPPKAPIKVPLVGPNRALVTVQNSVLFTTEGFRGAQLMIQWITLAADDTVVLPASGGTYNEAQIQVSYGNMIEPHKMIEAAVRFVEGDPIMQVYIV